MTSPVPFPHATRSLNTFSARLHTACWIFLLLPLFQPASAQDQGPLRVSNANELIEHWQPDQHLYVKGDVGVGVQQLAKLELWLDQNAKHWTVFLIEHADHESFQKKDGRNFVNLDAVEIALSYGLSNRTSFGEWTHPKTGEADGAILLIALRERKFSYFASQAQDQRQLGMANWIGELDQPAFRAMRNGGRILDAVKDTIQSIQQKLEQKIASEERSAANQRAEHLRRIQSLRANLSALDADVEQISTSAANLRSDLPNAKGSLAFPPLDPWHAAIADWTQILQVDSMTAESLRAQDTKQKDLKQELDRFLNGYAARLDFSHRRDEMADQTTQWLNSPATRDVAADLQTKLDQITQAFQNGDDQIANLMQDWQNLLLQGQELKQQDDARLAAQRFKQSIILGTLLSVAGLLTFILGLVLWLLNRRRQPSRTKALTALAEREKSINKEIEAVDRLFLRNEELLGSPQRIADRGYEGLTKETTLRALQYVDDLFIMAKEVRRVLEEARDLILPKSWWGKWINLWSASRYEQGINHVSGKPLKFTRTHGIPLIVRDLLQPSDNQASAPIPDEVTLTYEQIFQAFTKRSAEAEQALNLFESSQSGIQDALSQLQSHLETAFAEEKELAEAGLQDGYFIVPDYLQSLIPSVQSDLAQADQLSAFNAVQAMQVVVPAAQRKLDEAKHLADLLQQSRADHFPKLTDFAAKLKSHGFTSDWIDRELDAITHQANALYAQATTQSIQDPISNIASRLEDTLQRADAGCQLATRMSESLEPNLFRLRQTIDTARQRIGRDLQIPVESTLRELQRDPDEFLRRAQKNFEAAQTMLTQGRMDASLAALDTADTELAQGNTVVERTLAALTDFSQRLTQYQKRLADLFSRHQEINQQYLQMQHRFHPDSFLLAHSRSADAVSVVPKVESSPKRFLESPDQSVTADEMLELCLANGREVESWMQEATTLHQQGHILKASDLLDDSQQSLEAFHTQLDRVVDHFQQLDQQSLTNVQHHQRLLDAVSQLLQAQRDPLIRQSTLTQLQNLAHDIESVKRDLGPFDLVIPNPFKTAATLADLAANVQHGQASLVADRQAHAEANRAVQGAISQWQAAQQLAQQSQSDQIPDSQKIVQANRQVDRLQAEVQQLQQQLKIPHSEWRDVDHRASQLQTEISATTQILSSELQIANQAWQAFQLASREVFQAEQWTGPFGLSVLGSPGVKDLERARRGLQNGDYSLVLEISRLAASAAQSAIQQMEREVARRKLAQQMAAEQARRAREAALRPTFSSRSFGGSGSSWPSSSSSSSSWSRGSSSSSSSSNSSSSSSNGSGFSRSGW